MKKIGYLMAICILVGVMFLSACGDKEQKQTDNQKVVDEQGASKQPMPGSGEGPELKEADVPAKEKKELLAAVDRYIAAFNSQDIDAFMGTFSNNPDSFDLKEEKASVIEKFEKYEMSFEPLDIVIIDFEEEKANVYLMLDTSFKEIDAEKAIVTPSRQINMMEKEDGEWKIKSVHVVGV